MCAAARRICAPWRVPVILSDFMKRYSSSVLASNQRHLREYSHQVHLHVRISKTTVTPRRMYSADRIFSRRQVFVLFILAVIFDAATQAMAIVGPDPSSNTDRMNLLSSWSAGINYRCVPESLGTGLSATSCQQALSSFSEDDTTLRTWGPRDTGMYHDFQMPQRWVSRICLAGNNKAIH